jgi:hypothetical protein
MRSRGSRGSPAAAIPLHRRLQVGSVAQRLVLTGGLPGVRWSRRPALIRAPMLGEPGRTCPRRPAKERAYGY